MMKKDLARVLLLLMSITYSVQAQLTNVTTPYLNVTTVAAVNQSSVLQCWQICMPFKATTVPGTVGALNLPLGDVSNMSYTILPSRFSGGVHNAPSMQWVVLLSGLAHVSLPNVTKTPMTEAWVQGGKYGVILAVDTADVSKYGHISDYPSDADTAVLQIPIRGSAPEHSILYEGPCMWPEMVGV